MTTPASVWQYDVTPNKHRPGFVKELYHIGMRSSNQPSKKDGSYPLASTKTKDHKQLVYFPLVNFLDKNAYTKYKAYKHLKPHRDAIYVVDMEDAQALNFKFYHTLKCCVTCFDIKTSSTSRKAETYSKIRGPLAHMPTKKDRNDSVVEKNKRNSHARVIGKRYFATGNSMRAKQGRSGLPEEKELRRGRKEVMESPVPVRQHEKNIGTTFCACGDAATSVKKEKEEQARSSLQEGFTYIQALTQVEIRLRKSTRESQQSKSSTTAPREGQRP